uniref:Uncharacterized protein n=1 Tax=Vibrio splendidus TaxID=29497 RepID=A0A0H3ZX08_VIBSP|nr:hypothetical protein [Vibrio splendidus]
MDSTELISLYSCTFCNVELITFFDNGVMWAYLLSIFDRNYFYEL